MARARNIKFGLLKNEILGTADPLYTLLFEGLWMLADREGRLEDRPLRIKAEVFPYRHQVDMEEQLEWLQANGFILRYKVRGKAYIVVLEFKKHQNPHKNEGPSEIPPPEDATTISEEIGTTSEFVGSTRADSLIPDSGFRIPEVPPPAPAPRPKAALDLQPEDVGDQVWSDWCQLRKQKKAAVTQTAVNVARQEAGKAGMSLEQFLTIWCARGSQGLEASWLKPEERARGSPQSFRQQDAEAAAARVAAFTGNLVNAKPHRQAEVIDVTARRLDRQDLLEDGPDLRHSLVAHVGRA